MATVDRDPSHVPAAVQRHHRLVCYEHGGDLHLLHQDLGHLGLVLLAGEWLLGDQERLGGGLGFELVLEDVVQIVSRSSQSCTTPCLMGWLMDRMPRRVWAWEPT